MRARVVVIACVGMVILAAALINSRRGARVRDVAPSPVRTSAAPPAPEAELGCSHPDSTVITEVSAVLSVAGHPNLQVISRRCVDNAGTRRPSVVQLIDRDDDRRVVRILIAPAAQAHVESVVAASGLGGEAMITITSSVHTPTDTAPAIGIGAAPASQGRIVSQVFGLDPNLSVHADTTQVVGNRCQPSQLAVTATAATARRAIIRLVNISHQPCGLEGYLAVTGLAASDETVALPRPAASTGGVLGPGVPSVLVVKPGGGVVSAVLDSADETPAGGPALCSHLDALRVALPAGEQVLSKRFSLEVCQFQVHPLVAGSG